MKVLLCQDVETLGWYGDIVEVRPGYARNYLLPYGIATEPSEDKIKSMSAERAQRAQQRQLAREKLEQVAEQVDGAEVVIEQKANEQGHLFGSVTEKMIAEALRGQNFEIADKVVDLSEHIKEVGEYQVRLRFAADLTASVNVKVSAEGQQAEQDDESVESESQE